MPRFIPQSPEPTPRQMLALASGLNAALRGDCANAGLLEVPEGASSAEVRDSRCRAGRLALLIPLGLLYRYITDPELLAEVKGLVSEGRIFDPQHYAAETDPVREALVRATELNQVRKFARYYPKPTESSF